MSENQLPAGAQLRVSIGADLLRVVDMVAWREGLTRGDAIRYLARLGTDRYANLWGYETPRDRAAFWGAIGVDYSRMRGSLDRGTPDELAGNPAPQSPSPRSSPQPTEGGEAQS